MIFNKSAFYIENNGCKLSLLTTFEYFKSFVSQVLIVVKQCLVRFATCKLTTWSIAAYRKQALNSSLVNVRYNLGMPGRCVDGYLFIYIALAKWLCLSSRATKTTHRGIFLMNFEVYGNVMKHCFECLIYLLNRN